MGKMKKHVKNYLDGIDDWSRVIILTTCGSEDPVPVMYGIDSITAASKKDEVNIVTADLKNRLETTLKIQVGR